MEPREITLTFEAILVKCGFQKSADGKFNLPNTQITADRIGRTVLEMVPWCPGDPPYHVTLTGAAPIWAYAMAQHALHGRAQKLTIAAPAATIVVFGHGV